MRFCFCLLLALFLLPYSSLAQNTIGFEHPKDTSNLLEYRLPDWSYRTWTAGMSLDGGSSETRSAGTPRVSNSLNLGLDTAYRFHREGDSRDYYYSGSLDGSLHRQSNRWPRCWQKNTDTVPSSADPTDIFGRMSWLPLWRLRPNLARLKSCI